VSATEPDTELRPGAVLVCVDGSDLSIQAARAALDLFPELPEVVVVNVVEEADPMLVTGTGIAGGVMSADEFAEIESAHRVAAQRIVDEAVTALNLPGAHQRLVEGAPGNALCGLAEHIGARAVVIGTRGRGGIKRAVRGSVSAHVVRHSPCPVIVSGPALEHDTPA
jgi:nucleotide-binding universal stress UspA family protein